MNVEDYHRLVGGRRVWDRRYVDVPPAPEIRDKIATLLGMYSLNLGRLADMMGICSASTLSLASYGRAGYKMTDKIVQGLDGLLNSPGVDQQDTSYTI